MLEAAVPLSVAHAVRRPARAGQGRRRPDLARLVVAQVERLAGRVRDRIVRPRGDPIRLAVALPGEARPALRDQEPEARIRDDVDPRRRRRLAGMQVDHVLAAIRCEPAQAIGELQVEWLKRGRRLLGRAASPACNRLVQMPEQRAMRRVRQLGARQLAGESAPAGQEHDAGGRQQQGTVLLGRSDRSAGRTRRRADRGGPGPGCFAPSRAAAPGAAGGTRQGPRSGSRDRPTGCSSARIRGRAAAPGPVPSRTDRRPARRGSGGRRRCRRTRGSTGRARCARRCRRTHAAPDR